MDRPKMEVRKSRGRQLKRKEESDKGIRRAWRKEKI